MPPSEVDEAAKASTSPTENTDSSTSPSETAVSTTANQFLIDVSLAGSAVLPNLRPPSEEEQNSFYYGIPSCPRLVGRASSTTKPWVSFTEQRLRWQQLKAPINWRIPIKKRLSNIGVHRIRTCWEEVEPFITKAVGRLPWTSINILRMTEVEDSNRGEKICDNPVVVWVGVEHHDIAYDLVAEALRACRFALDSRKLSDVDVQIRASNVFPLATPQNSSTSPTRAMDSCSGLDGFRATLGVSMCPFKYPYINGTLGLFVSPATAVDEADHAPVLALTCRHVGLPADADATNMTYSVQDSTGNDRHLICLPVDDHTHAFIGTLEQDREASEEVALQSGLEKDKVALHKNTANVMAAKALEEREARISGSVLFAPPVSKPQTTRPGRNSPITWFRDYCVLEIRRDNFPEVESFTNTIDLSAVLNLDRVFAFKLYEAQKLNQPGFEWSSDKVIRVKGMIPLSEMRCPPGSFENSMQENGFIVVKRGMASGITFGYPSELMSRVRSDDGAETLEWAILGSFGSTRKDFSERGDSGAAVVGLDGRLGGFLTRGAGEKEESIVDVTYVTPAELVLADIEKELGNRIVIR